MLSWPALDALGVTAVVTTRDGGMSTGPYRSLNLALHVGDDPDAVVGNRRRAARAVGADLDDLVVGEQVHGRAVAVVAAADRGRGARSLEDTLPGVDALVTAEPGPVLVTLVADCVPVALVDPVAGVAAAVHAGWRGTAARVVEAALESMVRLGARPTRVVAGIGPAVSPRTYVVGDEVAAACRDALGPAADGVVVVPAPASAAAGGDAAAGGGVAAGDAAAGHGTAGGGGRWLVDLPEANRQMLVAAGVPPEAVHVATVTTGGGPFYSDREARPCGRAALLLRLHP